MVTLTVPVEATTPEGAAFSLVDSVASALPNAVPARLDRDLVSIPDIADRTNRSRESVRLLVKGKRGPGRFPSLVGTVGDAIRVWPWSSVLDWLLESGLVEEAGERSTSSEVAARVDACLAARKQHVAELSGYNATLTQIRKARALTQVQLAQALEVTQPEVSRIEHQTDLFVSTIRSYLEAMGADLQLVTRFSDGTAVSIAMDDIAQGAFGQAAEPTSMPPARTTSVRRTVKKAPAKAPANKRTVGVAKLQPPALPRNSRPPGSGQPPGSAPWARSGASRWTMDLAISMG